MMKARLLIFALFVAVVSCKDNDAPNVCHVDDPVNDLEWLKTKIDELENSEFSRKYFYVEQAEYNGQTIFYINNCCPMCMTMLVYYDCSGNAIESVDNSQVKNGKRIWMSEDLECVF
jgi:hypothetical protein